jgi:hypothetical protein
VPAESWFMIVEDRVTRAEIEVTFPVGSSIALAGDSRLVEVKNQGVVFCELGLQQVPLLG